MFNEERKVRYITKKESEVSLNKYFLNNIFTRTEKFEEKYEKDVCDWTTKEIISYYKYCDIHSMSSLIVLNSAFGQYCNWCMTELLVADGQNHFLEISQEILGTCVNHYDLNKLFITREELSHLLIKLANPVDKFLMLALFEGIKGDYSKEITHLKISDIDGLVAHLDGRDAEISQELKNYCFESAETFEYYPYSRYDRATQFSKEEPDLVYKQNIYREHFDDYNLDRSVGLRFKTICEYLGLPKGFTSNKLCVSGKLAYIKQLVTETGLPLETVIKEFREEIDTKYPMDKIVSVPLFLTKYSKYFE